MTVILKSSDVQQNFGRVMEQAVTDEDVIVERYGQPRVAILSYRRYQQLLQLEQEEAGVYLALPQDAADVRQQGLALAKQVRETLAVELDASLDEVMTSLRGRTWSP